MVRACVADVSFFKREVSVDFIEVIDGALSADVCCSLRELFDRSPHVIEGRAGGLLDRSKKISQDLILNDFPEYAEVLRQVTDVTSRHLADYMNKYRFALIAPIAMKLTHPVTKEAVDLTIDNFEELTAGDPSALMRYLYRLGHVQMQKYAQGVGNYHYWHCEVFPMAPHNEQLHRSLLFMFYLNDVTEGGETEFYYQGKSIAPRAGRMVIAPAYFTHTHRGCIPISDDKYILTSWVLLQRSEHLYV